MLEVSKNNSLRNSKPSKSKAPAAGGSIAKRMAAYQQNVKVMVDADKVASIKNERKSHIVKQSQADKKKSTAVIEQAVEDKKAKTFDSLMSRLGGGPPPDNVENESRNENHSGDTKSSQDDDVSKPVLAEVNDNNKVLSMNNSQAFERIDRRAYNSKAEAKLHEQYQTFVPHVSTLDVETVEMANCELTDKFAQLVAEHWIAPKDSKLVSLNLESNLIDEDGLIALAKAVGTNNTLQSIFLRHQMGKGTVSTRAAEAWCEALEQNTTILKVGLDSALKQHRETIQKYLDRNADLRRKARRQDLQKKGVKIQPLDSAERRRIRAVAANESGSTSTADPKPSVFRFPDSEKRSFKALKSAEKAELGSAFGNNTVFVTVDLQSLELNDEFGLALAESLKANTTLASIDLSNNRLTSKSLDAIAKVLRDDNRTLKELKLLNQTPATGIVRATETLLAEAVGQNPVLNKLALSKWTDSFARDQVDKKLMKNKWNKKK